MAELIPSVYPGLDPVSSISTRSQCPSVQIIIGRQKVFFFFHFHESNLLQKSPSTSSIHGKPVKIMSMNNTRYTPAQPNLEIHASGILQLSPHSG
jgi:hypothetical protein